MAKRSAVWLAAVALFLAPTVAADTPVHVEVAQIALSGEVQTEGAAPAIEMDGTPSQVPLEFSLTGGSAHLSMLTYHCSVVIGSFPVAPTCDPIVREDGGVFQDVELQATPRGDRPYLFLVSSERTTIVRDGPGEWSSMANVRLTEHGTMTPQAKDAVATDAPAGLQEASRSAAHVVIRGDFRLVLWDWSIAGNTAEGPFDLTTGQWDRRLAGPDVSGLHIAEEGGQRQAYLDVTNGTFEARWTQGQRVTLWQSLQSLHANGAAQLLGVVAANGIDVPGDADRLTFTGQVDLTVLAADASHARVGVAGDWAATDGGGRTLAVAAVPLNVPWTPIILGVLASAAVAAVVRRRINSVRFEELRADIELHEYPAALRRARQLRRVGRLRADVRLLHCIALLRMQDIEGAARILGERDEWPGPTATWSYLAATLAVARNRTEAALGHLRESIQQAPELVVEIESNPLLAPLLGRALGSHDPVGYV